MKTRLTRSATRIRLSVTGHVKPDDLRRLSTRLIDALPDTEGELTVDVRRVEEAVLPFIQLLVSAKKTAAANGVQFDLLDGHDGVVTRLISTAALTEIFGLSGQNATDAVVK